MNSQTQNGPAEGANSLVAEVKKEEKLLKKLLKDVRILIALVVLLAAGIAGGVFYFIGAQNTVAVENSSVAAPSIDLAPVNGGKLEAVYVNEGDTLAADTVVARVGDELVKSKIAGLVIMAREDIGKQIMPGEKVVSMIDPGDLRVVGRLSENKGLKNVSVGDRASFTADAFGGREYFGIVDEISPTSRVGDVVFSISDKRQEQEFNVKVRFDVDKYPELKNGMSAKLKIYRD